MTISSVPLFPLPGFVLFPRTRVPLHIFEPRYYRMITDALAGERRIATGNLRKGWEKDYFGAPKAHRVVTIARILDHEELPERRYNILLEGIERAALVDELAEKPYRIGRVAPLVDLMDDADREPVRAALAELLSLAKQIADGEPEWRALLTNLENRHLHPGIIADHVAAALVADGYERQSLLEQRRVSRRIELLNVQLRLRVSSKARRESGERAKEPDRT